MAKILFTKVINNSFAQFCFHFSAIEFSLGFCNVIFPCFDFFRVSPCRIFTVNIQSFIIRFEITRG